MIDRAAVRRHRRLMRRAGRRLRLARFWHRDGDLDEAVRHGRRALRLVTEAEPATAPDAATLAIDVALTLALVERDRAAYTTGIEHATYAVGLLDALPPAVDRDRLLAQALIVLADLHRRTGDYQAVDAALHRARHLVEASPDRDLTVRALTVEGIAAKERGAFDQAARCYAEIGRLLDGDRAAPAEIAALHHNLAGLAYARGDHVEAESQARRAVAVRRAQRRTDPVDLAQDLAVLASALAGLHRYDEAIALFEQARTVCQRARPPRQYEIAVHLHNLAAIHHSLGAPGRADQLYREALAIKETLLGAEHPEVGLLANNLGTLLREQGRAAEAEACFRRALTIVERAYPPTHPVTKSVRRNLDRLS
jgi:tetratricopeptide (TPR) repeat protein